MKRVLVAAMCLLLALLIYNSSSASAQTPTPVPSPSPTATAAATASPVPTASPAAAASPSPAPTAAATAAPSPLPAPALPPLQGLFGAVRAVSTAALTIDTRGEPGPSREVQVAVNAQTRVSAPPKQAAAVSDIKVGDRLALLLSVAEGKFTALQIVIIPVQPVRKHIQGIVMEVAANRITLMDRDGKVFNLQVSPGLAAPAAGQFIVATVEEDPSTRQLRLAAFEVSDKVLDRLDRHRQGLQGRRPRDEDEGERIRGDLEKLEDLLTRNAERHLEVLEGVLEKAPEQARAALTRVLEKARDRKGEIKEKIESRGRGRGGVEPPGPPGTPGPAGPGGPPEDRGKPGSPGKSGR